MLECVKIKFNFWFKREINSSSKKITECNYNYLIQGVGGKNANLHRREKSELTK